MSKETFDNLMAWSVVLLLLGVISNSLGMVAISIGEAL